jgi:hypothetical protein
MTDQPPIDVEQLVDELKERADRERAAGGYPDADMLAAEVLPVPDDGFDLESGEGRVRFRPELGYSAKPVVGPVLTWIKKLNLRLLGHVLTDLAQQADAAVTRLGAALSFETAARESSDERLARDLFTEVQARAALEREVSALTERIAALEAAGGSRRPSGDQDQ